MPISPKILPLPPSAIYSVRDSGKGTLAQGGLLAAFQERSEWLAEMKSKIGAMWCDSPHAQYALSGASRPDSFYLASFLVPPVSNSSGDLRIQIYMDWNGSTDGAIYAQWFVDGGSNDGDWVPAAAAVDLKITDDGWSQAGAPHRPASERALVLRVFGRGLGSEVEINSVCIHEESDTGTTLDDDSEIVINSSATLKKKLITHAGTTDRPLDVWTLRQIKRWQSHVRGCYVRHIGSHSYEARDNTAATSYRYRFRRGPQDTSITVRVLCSDSGSAGTIEVYLDAAGAGPTLRAGTSGNVSSSSDTWLDLTVSAGSTKNALHDFVVKATPSSGGTISVKAICVEENEYSASSFVYSSGGQKEKVPEKLKPIDTGALVGGGLAIVGSYRTGDIQARWTDVETQAENAIFNAHRRAQMLVSDWIGRNGTTADASSGMNGTVASFASPTTLYRGRFTTTRGTAKVEVFARYWKAGTGPSFTYRGQVQLYVGTSGGALAAQSAIAPHTEDQSATRDLPVLDGTSAPHPSFPAEGWSRIGVVDVDEDTLYEFAIKGGMIDATDYEPTASTTDALVLDGVFIREIPAQNTPSSVYFYGESSPGVTIPDNDAGGVSDTITVAADRDFIGRNLRVYIEVTHADPTEISAVLQSDSAGSFTILTALAAASGWYSVDVLGDNDGSELVNFEGEAIAGDWTLTLIDGSATSEGTLDKWAIELT